jgi:hypothetical protein
LFYPAEQIPPSLPPLSACGKPNLTVNGKRLIIVTQILLWASDIDHISNSTFYTTINISFKRLDYFILRAENIN